MASVKLALGVCSLMFPLLTLVPSAKRLVISLAMVGD